MVAVKSGKRGDSDLVLTRSWKKNMSAYTDHSIRENRLRGRGGRRKNKGGDETIAMFSNHSKEEFIDFPSSEKGVDQLLFTKNEKGQKEKPATMSAN